MDVDIDPNAWCERDYLVALDLDHRVLHKYHLLKDLCQSVLNQNAAPALSYFHKDLIRLSPLKHFDRHYLIPFSFNPSSSLPFHFQSIDSILYYFIYLTISWYCSFLACFIIKSDVLFWFNIIFPYLVWWGLLLCDCLEDIIFKFKFRIYLD